jgi:gamma-glutamyltranspeptidase
MFYSRISKGKTMTVEKISFAGANTVLAQTAKTQYNKTISKLIGQSDKDAFVLSHKCKTSQTTQNNIVDKAGKILSTTKNVIESFLH